MAEDDARFRGRPPEWTLLGDTAKRRRQRLGLTHKQVHDRGGPSPRTLGRIENGREQEPSLTTAQRLERGLGWPIGTVQALRLAEDPPGAPWIEALVTQPKQTRHASRGNNPTISELRERLEHDGLVLSTEDRAHLLARILELEEETLPRRIADLTPEDRLRVSRYVDRLASDEANGS